MPKPADFRNYTFDSTRVDLSGKDVGKKVYWKLYAVENVIRVLAHSVLLAQVGADWWTLTVDPAIKASVEYRKADYAARPWHSTPGRHEIYYAFLSDLNKIITANSHLFAPHIPELDQWIVRLEQLRLPRNIVGHMNWLSATDRQRIDVVYADLQHLLRHLGTAGLTLVVP
jgi:hypothetical protein